ncbi:MAG TPA: hypothetical protein P5110_03710 [Candidatus Omnitrophota bacterium]|nr:hypothetical protein [Candidatus Omnitrophota bacterium]HRZ14598.1 hypothetical protein [Candidatus Omnitrophota bacterium]
MFNPHARWDRKLPCADPDAAETVEVCARFLKGKVIPLYFTVSGSRIAVKRINYSWQERKGNVILRYFSVADAGDTYCLCLDPETMIWRLWNP